MAGTIGAKGNNDIGVAGVGWNASMMALRAVPGTFEAVARAVDYATENGARITNNSYGAFGNFGVPQVLSDAVTRAKNAGVLFVAAAGNDSTDLDGSLNSWPAELSKTHDNVIAVASSIRRWHLRVFKLGRRVSADCSSWVIHQEYGSWRWLREPQWDVDGVPNRGGSCRIAVGRASGT